MMLKRIFKWLVITIFSLMLMVGILIYCDVLWLMAPYYEIRQETVLTVPVMDMKAYDDIINTH